VHHYFAYRAKLNRFEFRHLLKQGRTSLIIGLAFLGACLLTREFFLRQPQNQLSIFLRESLLIAGWVAMWRPMQIFLYDWWPLRPMGRLYEKMSRMRVEVRKNGQGTANS
jgi:predicted membrane protein